MEFFAPSARKAKYNVQRLLVADSDVVLCLTPFAQFISDSDCRDIALVMVLEKINSCWRRCAAGDLSHAPILQVARVLHNDGRAN